MIDFGTSLGGVVTRRPGHARGFERRDIDYRRGGDRALANASVERELDLHGTVVELRAAAGLAHSETPARTIMGVAQLVDHIERTHHRCIWDDLPKLSIVIDKVVKVHGDRDRELYAVRQCFQELRADLERNLTYEERVLFPMIRRLATTSRTSTFMVGASGTRSRSWWPSTTASVSCSPSFAG